MYYNKKVEDDPMSYATDHKNRNYSMAISTDTHVKIIYTCIASMFIGWTSGVMYSNNKMSDLRYDTQCSISSIRYDVGVQFAEINAALGNIESSLIEIKEELKLRREYEQRIQKDRLDALEKK